MEQNRDTVTHGDGRGPEVAALTPPPAPEAPTNPDLTGCWGRPKSLLLTSGRAPETHRGLGLQAWQPDS